MQKVARISAVLALVVVTLSISVSGAAAAADGQSPEKTGADTLIVIARLTEIPGTFPPNDLYNYVYIMKYRVLKVESGTYKGREILVGQYNPLIPRDKIDDKMDPVVGGTVEAFEEGDKHRLVLVKPLESVWQEAVEDEYFDSEMKKHYAVQTDTAD